MYFIIFSNEGFIKIYTHTKPTTKQENETHTTGTYRKTKGQHQGHEN